MTYNYIISVFVELVRTILIVQYFQVFFDKNNSLCKYLVSGFMFVATVLVYITFNNVILNMIITFVTIFAIANVYSGSLKKKFLLSCMNFGICCAIDIICSFILGVTVENRNNEVIGMIMSLLIFYVVILIIKKIYNGRIQDEFAGKWYFLLIISAMSIASEYILSIDKGIAYITVIEISFIILLINVILYFFYLSMIEQYSLQQEMEALKKQMDVHELRMQNNIQNERNIRAIKHDMKHHIRELTYLVTDNNYAEVKKYLNSLENDVYDNTSYINSGNQIMDGIINYYICKFKENKIQYETKIVVPDKLDISSYDLNIILGNLLDNSVQSTILTQAPSINIRIEYKMGILYIYVSNSCLENSVTYKNNKIISTKGSNHGYGISNIDKIVKKVTELRIFKDDAGKTNLSLQDVNGELLVVSQFTLLADCKKGRRPSFVKAGNPQKAEEMYEEFIRVCKDKVPKVEHGVFGADMKVELLNDGPFTIVLDSKEL